MTASVRAVERLRDAAAVTLLVAGAALFFYAYRGMQDLAAGHFTVGPGELAVRQWARYRDLSVAGLAIVALGIGVAVWSYLRRSRRPAETHT